MLFEEAYFAGMRLVTVVFVQRWNDFLADVQELRFQTDEHARHRRLPRFFVNHTPTPVLQLIRARQYDRRRSRRHNPSTYQDGGRRGFPRRPDFQINTPSRRAVESVRPHRLANSDTPRRSESAAYSRKRFAPW